MFFYLPSCINCAEKKSWSYPELPVTTFQYLCLLLIVQLYLVHCWHPCPKLWSQKNTLPLTFLFLSQLAVGCMPRGRGWKTSSGPGVLYEELQQWFRFYLRSPLSLFMFQLSLIFLDKPLLVIPVVLYALGEGATGSTRGLNLPPKVYAGAFDFVDSLMFGSKKNCSLFGQR